MGIQYAIMLYRVDPSYWPLLSTMSLVFLILSPSWIGLLSLFLVIFQWIRDILREAYVGQHVTVIQQGLLYGYLLFLLSEVMLFFSFFWAYFTSSLVPAVQIFGLWPPLGVNLRIEMALLGSLVLLTSGFLVTLSHHSIYTDKRLSIQSLIATILMGWAFLSIQYVEYAQGSFCLNDSVYGSVFYMTTGLHGVHVLLGTLFLMAALYRLLEETMLIDHHQHYLASIIYWHFVDVIWLFLFVVYYWWGS